MDGARAATISNIGSLFNLLKEYNSNLFDEFKTAIVGDDAIDVNDNNNNFIFDRNVDMDKVNERFKAFKRYREEEIRIAEIEKQKQERKNSSISSRFMSMFKPKLSGGKRKTRRTKRKRTRKSARK